MKAKYSKLHLYDVELNTEAEDGTPRKKRIGESDRSGVGTVGLEICYDLRFPELSIILTRMGADVLTFPSAFMLPTGKSALGDASCELYRLPYYEMIQRAAAIQYQTYVIASAQYGAHNASRSSWGESLAFDPWGRQLGRLRSMEDPPPESDVYDDSGEWFICEIDDAVISETRKLIPLAIQKRADIYGVVGRK